MRIAFLSLVGVLSALSATAYAQPEEWIEQGIALREQGRDADALDLFRRSYEASHSSRALAQMGLAEQALGRWLEADRHLEQALSAPDAWIESHRSQLGEARQFVQSRLGRIELSGGPAGAEVMVDGEQVATLPLSSAISVPAGSVVLEIRHPGYHPFRRELSVAANALTRETIAMVARAAGEAPELGAAASTSPGALALTFGGAGVAAVAAILLAIGLVDKSSVEGAAVGSHWSDVSGNAELAPALIGAGDVALVTGLLAAAAGIVWWLLFPDRSPAPSARGPRLELGF